MFNEGEPVEVEVPGLGKKIGRYRRFHDQYAHHEVGFADGTTFIGPSSSVRSLRDDENASQRMGSVQ